MNETEYKWELLWEHGWLRFKYCGSTGYYMLVEINGWEFEEILN